MQIWTSEEGWDIPVMVTSKEWLQVLWQRSQQQRAGKKENWGPRRAPDWNTGEL